MTLAAALARTRRAALLAAALLLGLVLLAGCGGGSDSDGSGGPPLVYVAMGASDAVGVGAVPLDRGYVYVLADRFAGLGFAAELANLGILGAQVEDLLADELPQALAAGPDVVTIWVGANDVVAGASPATFQTHLGELLQALAEGTDARIFVGDLPDLTQAPRFQDAPDPDVTEARVEAFNLAIEAECLATGAIRVPISTAALTDDLFFVDGFHPNNAGHAALADAFWAAIVANP